MRGPAGKTVREVMFESFLIPPIVLITAVFFAGVLAAFLLAVRRRWLARFHSGFWLTLLFALLGATLSSSVLVALWGLEVSERLFQKEIASELGEFSRLITSEINRDLEQVLVQMERVGAAIGESWGNEQLRDATLRSLLNFRPRFYQLGVYDDTFQLLGEVTRGDGREPVSKVAVAYALDGSRYVSEAFLSETWNDHVLTLTVPIVSPAQEVLGTLFCHFDFDRGVSGLLESARFGETGYAVVVSREGRILAHPEVSRINDDVSDYPAVQKAVQGEIGSLVARNRAGEERLFFYRPMDSASTVNARPLVLLTELTQSEAVAPLSVLREEFLLGVGFLIIGGLLVSHQMARSLQQPLTELARSVQLVQYGDFTKESAVEGKDSVGRLSGAFNQMLKGLRERDRVKELFGRYVTTQVSEEVLKGKVTLGGESRVVTILISDIRGFTTMAEKMDPKEVVAFLNDYFSEMVDAVFDEGGVLDKFLGDGMLVVFGALGDQPDHASRAVRAALRMKIRLAKLNEERIVGSRPPISIGVGIHTEEVVVGNIGSRKRLEYTVIGDGVNTASRVEGLNKQFSTSILITDATHAQVQDDFECRLMPEAALKGKTEQLRFYEVISSRQRLD